MTLIILMIGLLVGLGVVTLVVIGIVMLVRKNTGAPSSSAVEGHDASTYQPLVITATDLTLPGPAFISKYKNAFISFDGIIKETSTVSNAITPHTVLLVGDDANGGNLADGTEFWLTTSSAAFSSDLQEFASNTTPENNSYPKVSVIAKVVGYSEMYRIISLEPIANSNGVTPSVKSR